jgi:tRNA(Ile)-lysidine synthase
MRDDFAASFDDIPTASAWAVAVSGGADSTALLCLARQHRPDLSLVVAHLNHETRGDASECDARFVRELATSLNLPCRVSLRTAIEPMLQDIPKNASARYRAARLAFFRLLVEQEKLSGVLVAHHADDVAETMLLRLLRGGEPAALAGLQHDTNIDGLRIARPLLAVRRHELESYLRAINQPWREDASNASADYARNRVRAVLRDRPELVPALLKVSESAGEYSHAIAHLTPDLPASPAVEFVADLPAPVARRAVRRWLWAYAGVEAEREVVDRIVSMVRDRSVGPRTDVGAGVSVERTRTVLQIHRGAG